MKLVHSTSKRSIDVPLERHAAELAELGIDAINLHHTEWTAGLVALFHRFGLRGFAWDTQETRHIRARAAHGHRRRLLRPPRPHGRDRRRVDVDASCVDASDPAST